jgi:hypothetical protein
MVRVLSLVVIGSVMNWSCNHCLFIYALQFMVSTCCEIWKEISFPYVLNSLVEEHCLDNEL